MSDKKSNTVETPNAQAKDSPKTDDGQKILLNSDDFNIIGVIFRKAFKAGHVDADDAVAVGTTYSKIKSIIIEGNKRMQEQQSKSE